MDAVVDWMEWLLTSFALLLESLLVDESTRGQPLGQRRREGHDHDEPLGKVHETVTLGKVKI